MATNHIDSLTIKGYKSIRHLDKFPLHPLNVLIGANGAGKSNLVSYFRMLSELVEGRLQVWTAKQGGADRILTLGVKATDGLESYVKFGWNEYDFRLEPTVDGGFTFAREHLFFEGAQYDPQWYDLGAGHAESRLRAAQEREKAPKVYHYCYSVITSWRVYHFHDTSDTAGIKRKGALQDGRVLRSDASNLAAFLYWLREQGKDIYQQIRKTVQLAVPFFDDFVLEPEELPTEERVIRLLWRQKGSDYALWPSQLSDGSIRFICLVAALLQPIPPSTIVIDEPELGLHPYAITLLGSLLRSAARRMQVVVSTQSVPLLNEFSIDDLVVVEREEGNTVLRRCQEEQLKAWLEEYTVGELWEKNILGGRPGQ